MANVINIHRGVGTAITHTECLKAYLTNIRKYKLMEQKQEEALLREYATTTSQSRKLEIRNMLLQANQRFIVTAAKQFANNDVELLLDLINEANFGFIEAIDSFDFSKTKEGTRLYSWASFYIRRGINQYMQQYRPMVRQTNNAVLFHKVSKIRNKLTQLLEREPTDDEVLEYIMENKIAPIKEAQDVMKLQLFAVDAYNNDDEDNFNASILDFNEITAHYSGAEKQAENDYVKMLIKKAIGSLTEREKEIIEMIYGIGDSTIACSIESVADKFNFTTERIRQIHTTALKKMAKKVEVVQAQEMI